MKLTKVLSRIFLIYIIGALFLLFLSQNIAYAQCPITYCANCRTSTVGGSYPDGVLVCDVCEQCPDEPEHCYTSYDGCEGAGGCFLPDTKIAMPSGEKEIKDIKVGEKVKSFDPETGEIKEATVTATHKRQVEGYYILKTESGREIKVTGEHPILAQKAKTSSGNFNFLKTFFSSVVSLVKGIF